MKAYKLIRIRKDGSFGPLFINRKQIIQFGKWMPSQCIPTKGFAVRPGWHCTYKPYAPHLKMVLKTGERRVWCRVEIKGMTEIKRPIGEGGTWYLAKKIKFLNLL
ncbi:MAG: hypothetical protein M0P12_00080 [Paludibacteraceae bacterium]|nr:hypothetical protein [Paludibacteraceae bacterium]